MSTALMLAATFKQKPDPVANSLAWSAAVGAISILVLFLLLGLFRVTAWLAALVSLAVAIVLAIVGFHMPVGQSLDSALEGAAFGFFPILWIVINALWIYNMTVESGHFAVLRRSFSSVSRDERAQAIIIAFCFGALLEALAGFGTPVAICSVMLIALGFQPIRAAAVALVANTAPVAFGALAIPIVTLAPIAAAAPGGKGLTVDNLGAMVGRQTPILSVFVPLALVFIVDGRRGLRQAFLPAAVAGLAFGVAQYVTSNFISVQLADIVASLFSALCTVLVLRAWHPRDVVEGTVEGRGTGEPVPVAGGSVAEERPGQLGRNAQRDSRGEVFRAYAPYLIIIAVFVIANLPGIKGKSPSKPGQKGTGIESVTQVVHWPGLHIVSSKGKEVGSVLFKLNYLSAAGTLLLIAGIIIMLVLRMGPGRAARAYGKTLYELRTAIVTVMAVLALAYVLNLSGQTISIGTWMAKAGGIFALLSPLLGWIGVAVTGSDTSSNSLFGALQVTAANGAKLSPVLIAAGNSSGGVLGKMISPQNLAIGAAAVGMAGQEGVLFRRVLAYSVVFVAFMAVLVYLQSTPVLSWMVVKVSGGG